jgi:hypothetical protein
MSSNYTYRKLNITGSPNSFSCTTNEILLQVYNANAENINSMIFPNIILLQWSDAKQGMKNILLIFNINYYDV